MKTKKTPGEFLNYLYGSIQVRLALKEKNPIDHIRFIESIRDTIATYCLYADIEPSGDLQSIKEMEAELHQFQLELQKQLKKKEGK